jgi:CII-binding regulator of phage lambda lysogenization HflD
MALNQMQTIQSLGNNLAMLQQEVETFGVSATETRHLVGRIGELYACVITNGQMAPNTNEKGYDVVSSIGGRISVKTTATTTPWHRGQREINDLERLPAFIAPSDQLTWQYLPQQ